MVCWNQLFNGLREPAVHNSPNTNFSDIMQMAWNLDFWENLYHRNSDPTCTFGFVLFHQGDNLPAHHCLGTSAMIIISFSNSSQMGQVLKIFKLNLVSVYSFHSDMSICILKIKLYRWNNFLQFVYLSSLEYSYHTATKVIFLLQKFKHKILLFNICRSSRC